MEKNEEGISMQKRSIALSIILSIVTCGIYGIYWYIKMTDEINSVAGEDSPSGVVAFLLSLITCGLYTFYWMYNMGKRLNNAKEQRGLPVDNNMPFIYIVLTIFGLGIISWAIMQDDLNKMLPDA